MKNRIECEADIAIVMATYNGEEYIKEQLDSIINQTYKSWNLFIHDDGSTDNTLRIINDYIDKYDEKIKLISGPKTGGAKNNFFYLMKHVDANYMMFSDQDDVWLKDKVEKTFHKMKEVEKKNDKKPILVYSDLSVVDENLNVISPKMSEYQKFDMNNLRTKDFLAENKVTGCTMMINKTLKDYACQAETYNDIIMHDWWIALLASSTGIIEFISEPLILYRQHGDNSVGALNFNFGYILKRMTNFQSVKERLLKTQNQAKYAAKILNLKEDNVVYKYGNLNKLRKMKRLNFYIKNGVKKSGIIRSIGLILYG